MKSLKKLKIKLKKASGRDRLGRVSVRHRGGAHKRFYRKLDFVNQVSGTVKSIEYDPNRTANIALVVSEDGQPFYIVAPDKIKVGDKLSSLSKTHSKPKIGERRPLNDIPVGLPIYNLELFPQSKAKMVRSAGTQALILSKEEDVAHVKLPSGEVRKFKLECLASIGQVSNTKHNLRKLYKAGQKRWRGIRPTVRGKAMHPKQHPHGGGEGGNPIGLKRPKTKWGKPAYGVKTRPRKKPSNSFIVKKRKVRK